MRCEEWSEAVGVIGGVSFVGNNTSLDAQRNVLLLSGWFVRATALDA